MMNRSSIHPDRNCLTKRPVAIFRIFWLTVIVLNKEGDGYSSLKHSHLPNQVNKSDFSPYNDSNDLDSVN